MTKTILKQNHDSSNHAYIYSQPNLLHILWTRLRQCVLHYAKSVVSTSTVKWDVKSCPQGETERWMRCDIEDGRRGAGSHCLDLLRESGQPGFATWEM